MTDFLHAPELWALIVLIGVIGLGSDAAWRSWTFEGRVADPSELYPRRAPHRLIYAYGPAAPPPWRTGNGWGAPCRHQIEPVFLAGEPTPARTDEGATADWSPVAEVAAAGQSLEDWWSERLQRYDEALRRIDSVQRLADGTPWHPPMALRSLAVAQTTDDSFEIFVAGSQRLHAYRELRIGATGEFSARDHMQLEGLLAQA
jgi:hypothetical protein